MLASGHERERDSSSVVGEAGRDDPLEPEAIALPRCGAEVGELGLGARDGIEVVAAGLEEAARELWQSHSPSQIVEAIEVGGVGELSKDIPHDRDHHRWSGRPDQRGGQVAAHLQVG